MIQSFMRSLTYATFAGAVWILFGGFTQWWHALVLGAALGVADEVSLALFLLMKPKWMYRIDFNGRHATVDGNDVEVSERAAWLWSYKR